MQPTVVQLIVSGKKQSGELLLSVTHCSAAGAGPGVHGCAKSQRAWPEALPFLTRVSSAGLKTANTETCPKVEVVGLYEG